MSEHQFETTAATKLPGQRILEHRADSPAVHPLSGPFEGLSAYGQGSLKAETHEHVSHGMAAARRSRAPHSLIQLQRRYGNRYVQRMLALARQGEGEPDVTPEVESSIEQSRGGGQELDSRTRLQMESAFGADFGGVRIHAGAEAHSLNRAVNAVAFTTGPDIFFRDGAYDPGSSGGRELLAHELTHVVQQGGAAQVQGQAQRFKVQRICSECEEEKKNNPFQAKLAVGAPDDQYEQEADRVAKSVVSGLDSAGGYGTGADPIPLVQRQSECEGQLSASTSGTPPAIGEILRATGQPFGLINRSLDAQSPPPNIVRKANPGMLQRAVTRSLGNGSITLNATAALFEGTTQLATVQFPTGSDQDATFPTAMQQNTNQTRHGTVRLNVTVNWNFLGPISLPIVGIIGSGSGNGSLTIETPFRILKTSPADDDTIVKFQQPRLSRQESSGTGAALDPQPQALADADDTGLSVSASPRVTYQAQLASQAGVGLGPTTIQEQVQTATTQAFGASFTVHVPVTRPQAPSPVSYDCRQAFGPFVIGSDQFMHEDDARQQIHDWYFGLEPAVRQDLELGRGILRATGRASSTGSRTFNLSLAERRGRKVRDIIADFAGSDAHMRSFALGEFGAQTTGEDPNERRVDVQVTGEIPGDQVGQVQGDLCSGGLGQTTPTGPTGPVTPPPTNDGGGAAPAPTTSGSGLGIPGIAPANFQAPVQGPEAEQQTAEFASTGIEQEETAGNTEEEQ